jgi:hypothetical protein
VVIVGSGFGGSVAALRAAEKGYHVGVMESGRRWKDEEIPKTLIPRSDAPGTFASTQSSPALAPPQATAGAAKRGDICERARYYPDSSAISANARFPRKIVEQSCARTIHLTPASDMTSPPSHLWFLKQCCETLALNEGRLFRLLEPIENLLDEDCMLSSPRIGHIDVSARRVDVTPEIDEVTQCECSSVMPRFGL